MVIGADSRQRFRSKNQNGFKMSSTCSWKPGGNGVCEPGAHKPRPFRGSPPRPPPRSARIGMGLREAGQHISHNRKMLKLLD